MAATTKRHGLFGISILSGIAAAALALSLLAAGARAGTLYWDSDGNAANGAGGSNGGTPTWDTTGGTAAALTNWWTGSYTADTAWNDTTNANDTAYFSGRTGTITLAAPITVNSLYFDATSGNAFESGMSNHEQDILTGGTITLNGTTPTITTVAYGPVSGQNRNTYTEINSILAGSSGITFAGSGNIYINNAANTFTGGVTLNGGGLVISAAGDLGTTNQNITLNNGIYAGLYVISNSFAYTGNVTTGTNGGVLDVYNGGTLTLNGNLGTGAGNFYKNDVGTLLIGSDNSASTFGAGSIVVNGGQIRSNAFSAVAGTGGTVNPLGNSTTNYTLNNSGSLYAQASAPSAAPATLGSLTVAGGNLLAVDASTTAGNSIALTFSSLNRSGAGTLVVNAVQSSLGANEKVAFGTAPATLNGGTMIAPWAVGTNSATAASPAYFLNYTSGLVAATPTVAGSPHAVDGSANNKLVNTTATDIVSVITAGDASLTATPQTVYALSTNQSITTTTAGTTLTIAGGGLIFNGTVAIGSAAHPVNVDFGSAEGLIFVESGQTGTIDNTIPSTSTGGFTKFGAGGLTLGSGAADTTANAYSGAVTVNGGTLTLNKAANTTAITGNLVIGPGANIGSVTGAVGMVTLDQSGQIAPTSTVTLNDGGVLNLANQSNTVAGLTLNGSGEAHLGSGTLTLGSGGITASTPSAWDSTGLGNYVYADINGSGFLNLGGLTQTITVNALTLPSAINNYLDDMRIDCPIQNGGLTKNGTGVLSLTSAASTFSGPVSVLNGILRIGDSNNQASVAPSANGPLGNSTSAISLGDAAGANNVVLQFAVNAGNFGRNILVTGSNSGGGSVTIEGIGTGNNGVNLYGNVTLNNRDVTFAVADPNGASGINLNGGINGAVTGTGNVTFTTAGMGQGDFTTNLNNPANNWVGATSILGGTIDVNNLCLPYNTAVTLDRGITGAVSLNIGNATVQIGSLTDGTANGSGILTFYGGNLDLGTTSGSTSFSGPISGTLTMAKVGASTQVFNSAYSNSGTVFVDGGTFALGTAGAMTGAGFTIQSGGTLSLNSSNNGAASVTRGAGVNDGGAITLLGNSSGNTIDALGTFALRSGAASIAVTPGSGQTSTLNFGAFSRTNNEDGTIVFSGPSLGAAAGSNVAQITFVSGMPAISNKGATNVTIIPYALGDTTPGGPGVGFVTYDTNGVRLLTSAEYASTANGVTNPLNTTTGQNLQLVPSDIQALAGTVAENSLFLNGGGINVANGAGTSLTINSGGAILSTGSSANTISSTTLAFGGEAIIDALNNLNISSTTITLVGAFTKTGAGTLSVAANLGNGTMTINNGTLQLGAANILNGTTGPALYLNQGGTLDVNGHNETVAYLTGFGQGGNYNGYGSASSNGGIITNNGSSNALVTLNSTSNATFYGGIQNGPTNSIGLVKNGTNTQTFWTDNPAGMSYTGGTTLNAGTLQYVVSGVSSFSLGATPATGTFANGVTLNNGANLEIDPMQFNGCLPSAVTVYSTPYNPGVTSGTVNFTTPVTVDPTGGGLYGLSRGVTNYAVNFTGAIALGGLLNINTSTSTTTGPDVIGHYSGPITLNQTAAGGLPVLNYQQAALGTEPYTSLLAFGYESNLDSVITDGSGSAVNPLALFVPPFRQFNVTGQSTYSHGTIVQGFVNLTANGETVGTAASANNPPITFTQDAQLGTGSVYIQPGSKLVMNAADNVDTPGNGGAAAITVSGSPLSQGLLDLAFNYSGTQANLGVAAASSGVLAIDNTGASSFTANLNMAALGNGKMFLGSLSAGTYAGTALTPAADNVYRLGGGGGTLTVSNAVLSGGTSLVVGEPAGVLVGGLGVMDPALNNNNPSFPNGGSGSVVLGSANGFTGSVTVNEGSKLTAAASAAAALFGSTTQAVQLNGGALQVAGIAAGSNTSVGAVTINGFGKLGVTPNGSNPNILTVASLSINSSRPNHEVLVVDSAVNGTTAQLIVSSGMPAMSNGILPGDFISSSATGVSSGTPQGNFLTYSAATGFAPYTGYVTGNSTWSNVDNSGTMVVSSGSATLNAGTPASVYGLNLTNDANLNLSGNTLGVGAGGIIFSANDSNATTVGITGGPVNFGSQEGFIYVANYTNNYGVRDAQIPGGIIGTGGLTISGPGAFYQASSAGFKGITGDAAGLTGTITVHQASLLVTNNQSNGMANSTFPIYDNYALDAGTIGPSIYNRMGMSLMGQITLLGGGGAIESANDNWGSAGEGVVLNGQISGAAGSGPLTLLSGGATVGGNGAPVGEPFYIFNAANNYPGGTVINNPVGWISSVNVAAGSSLGTGDAAVNGTTLNLNGSGNIASAARLSAGASTTVDFQAGSIYSPGTPAVGTLEGSGNIVLGQTGSIADNLTVGGANVNTLFDGVISQASGAAAGNVTKVGSGTLTLAGPNTYTGITTVSGGAINLLNGLSLQNTPVSVTPVNGLTFTPGLTAASLGALWGADNFALDDSTSPTPLPLTLTVGGTNLAGASSGGLTGNGSLVKAGTAIQALGGTNSYTGGTTVNGGTLRATSTTAFSGTSGVSVASGGSFDFASGSGGTLNVGSGGNAPLSLAGGSGIGAELGGRIKVGAVTAAGAVKVDVYGTPAVASPSGSYTLVSAASGLTGATYSLGNVYNNTNFTLSAPSATATTIAVTATPQAALTAAFWKGTLAGGNNVLALSDGSANSNWSTTAGGSPQALVPGASTAVTFSSGGSSETSLILGANMNFGATTIAGSTAVTLNADGNSLTVDGPLSVTNTATTILNAPVTVSGVLTVNTAATTALDGGLAGSGMVLKLGSGTTTIGGGSTYSGPANILGGTLVLGPSAPVGAAIVRNGATLQVNAAGSLPASIDALAPPVIGGPAVLSSGPDFPATQALLNTVSSTSKGLIVLGTDTASNLSFTTLPNVFLGSTTAASQTSTSANENLGVTDYGSSLTPGSNGYQLGGGNGVLSIYNSVLVGSNNLTVGQPYPVGVTASASTLTGTVNLRAANSFSGTITVNNGSTLNGLVQGTGSPFGASTNAVNLNGGTLQLEGDPVRQLSNNVGTVTVQGAGAIAINGLYGQSATTLNTTLTLASVARTNQGTLFVGAQVIDLGSGNSFNTLGGSVEGSRIFATTPGSLLGTTTLNGGTTVLTTPFAFGTASLGGAPTVRSGFLTYGANGFASVVPTRLDTGTAGPNLAGAASNDLVYVTGADSSMTTSGAIQDLTINGGVAVTATGTPTLTIAGGGIVSSNNANSIGTSAVGPIVNFAGVEGIIDVQGSTLTINSQVTNTIGSSSSAGLTKTGTGTLALANTTNNFTGLVTIDQGQITATVSGTTDALGNTANGILLNGGILSVGADTAFARNIALGPVGGCVLATGALALTGNITGAAGTGPLVLAGNGQAITVSGAANTYAGGTVLVATGNTLTVNVGPSSSLGGGDVDLLAGNTVVLNLLDNGDIASTARLNIDSGNTANFTSAAPAIGSLEGAGSLALGNSTGPVNTTLTTGGDNLSTAFTGVISQASGTASGLTKTGTGTLILTGSNTYTGATTANGGLIDFSSLSNLGAGTAIKFTGGGLQWAVGNTADISTRTVSINVGGATLDVQSNNVTLANAIGNGGSGSLTKLGSGTLTLVAADTYAGNTTVSAGTLSVSNDDNLGNGGGEIILNGGALSANSSFTLNHSRGIVVGPATGSGSGTLDVAPGQILTYNGVISDSSLTTGGSGELIKTGAGELKLGGTGTYTGGTSVEDGLLVIDSSEAIPSRSTLATTVNAAIVLGDPSLPSDGTALGGLAPGSGGGPAAAAYAVPEPGTLALLAAACGFAVLWLRRKGRK